MHLLLGFIGLLTVACWGQQQIKVVPDLANVSIAVTTTFGEPAGKVLVILKEVGSREKYDQIGTTIGFRQIPFGLYDLEIQAAGFSTRREQIGIYQRNVQLWFGIYPSPTHSAEPSEVLGSVTSKERNTQGVWVRLLPLYSADFVEDRVSSSGAFHFAGLHPGRYVLLVFDSEKLIMTKSVEYFGGKLKLDVDLPK